MPSIAIAVLAYAAGAVAGVVGVLLVPAVVALALLGCGLVARRAGAVAAGIFIGAGMLAGSAASRADRACAARITLARAGSLRAEVPLAPGTTAVARVEGIDGCVIDAGVSVAQGRVRAGATAAFAARPTLSPRGLTLVQARVREIDGPRGLPAAREELGRSIDEIFGGDAPLARALLIADTRGLAPAMRERYAAAGLVHMLSISGLHVGIIAAAVLLVVRAARAPPRVALGASVVLTAVYVAVIGAPPAALRAAAMLAASGASRWLGRPTSPWAALAVGAAFPLADPRIAADVGYQLSVVGMMALIVAGRADRRWIRGRVAGWRRVVVVALATSSCATLFTAPLVAWRFGQVSLVGPLSNLAAAPLMAVAQPALFLSLLLAPLPGVARFVAGAVHPVLAAFDGVATVAASVPLASLSVVSGGPAIALIAAATVLSAMAVFRDDPWRPVIGALALVVLAVTVPFDRVAGGALELHMIDVGQGDALALRTPRGRWILVDAGRSWPRGDAARTTVLPYLRARGGEIAALALSHPHADHVGGAATVIAQRRPALLLDPGFPGPSGSYRDALRSAREGGVRWIRARPGDSLTIDGVILTTLAPDSAWAATLDDANLASLVLVVRFGAIRFLLTGDAEREEEMWLVERDTLALRADVLKVAHHGSSTSSSENFLRAVKPRIALVSVGAGNMYGHPSTAVMGRLARSGATVFRTDRFGTVVVRTDGVALSVQTDERAWELP